MSIPAPPPPAGPPPPPGWPPPLADPTGPSHRAPRRGRFAALVVATAVLAGALSAGIVLLAHRAPGGERPPPAAVASAGLSPSPSPSGTPVPTNDPLGLPSEFDDPTGHFSAHYQQPPTRSSLLETVAGTTLAITSWEATTAVGESESVGFGSFPSGAAITPDQVLRASVDSAASRLAATVVSSHAGQNQGFPAMDAVLQTGGGQYAELRVVIAGHSLFLVMATGAANPPLDFALLAPTVQILDHAP